MKIDILTIFPAMFEGPLTESLLLRAREKNIIDVRIHDIRSFTEDRHHIVDDRPFGGGPGMVMKVEPVYRALESVGAAHARRRMPKRPGHKRPVVIYLSPQGETLNHRTVVELSRCRHLVLLCGHYEGVDERVMRWVDREISIGDYVLTGGELPAMVLVDSVVRQLPGVVKERASVEQDSFFRGLLDYPHYTRPATFKNLSVPDVLCSGNHALVERWREEQALLRTLRRRPDILERRRLSDKEKEILARIRKKRRTNPENICGAGTTSEE